MSVCLCQWMPCVCSAKGGRKKALGLLELELAVGSGAGNGAWVLWKCSQSSPRLSHLNSPRRQEHPLKHPFSSPPNLKAALHYILRKLFCELTAERSRSDSVVNWRKRPVSVPPSPWNLEVGDWQTHERPLHQSLSALPNITVPSAQGTKSSSNRWSDFLWGFI